MPRIAAVNQDRGIAPHRDKGAAVHLVAMRDAFARLDCDVVAFDQPDDAVLASALSSGRGEHPFDLVYERYTLGKATGARFARESGIPMVLEVNAPLADEQQRFRGTAETDADRASDNFLFTQANCVVAVSSAVAEYACARGAHPDAVMVCPNGVDTKRFNLQVDGAALRREYVPDGAFVIGFHGRPRPWHGFGHLVSAILDLSARSLPVHLLVIGEGEFEALDRLPEKRFTRVGWQPHARMPEFVAAFDALPLTYQPDIPFYFSPLKLMEAMACGVVPVVPDLGDLARVVDHGKTGYVYRPSDTNGMVNLLAQLIVDPGERMSIGRRAGETAIAYSWEGIAATVLDRVAADGEAGSRRSVSG
ncbi:MAG: glycosyltransferase family 4 protein [Woeseia sp.]